MLSLLRDMGVHKEGDMYCDSSAALAITQRRGAGKLRHIDVGLMWIQQERRRGDQAGGVKFHKIDGTQNPAYMVTKYVNKATMESLLPVVGCEWRRGRAAEGLEISRGMGYTGKTARKASWTRSASTG